MSNSYNPNSIGTPCCPFSGGVEEFTYHRGIGGVSYRCKECEGSPKERGWFSKPLKTGGAGEGVRTLIAKI